MQAASCDAQEVGTRGNASGTLGQSPEDSPQAWTRVKASRLGHISARRATDAGRPPDAGQRPADRPAGRRRSLTPDQKGNTSGVMMTVETMMITSRGRPNRTQSPKRYPPGAFTIMCVA